MLNIDPRMDFQHWALFYQSTLKNPESSIKLNNEESRVLYQVVQ